MIPHFLASLRIFKRLREAEMALPGLRQGLDRFGEAVASLATRFRAEHDHADALHIDLARTVRLLLQRMTACPNCGSVLDAAHPKTARYKTVKGDILCCASCRAFMKETLVRIAHDSEAKGTKKN